MNDSIYLDKALEIAKAAGEILKTYYKQSYQVQEKTGHTDFVTKADLESDKLITEMIKSHFPDHNIISEESTAHDQGSEFTWVIDPLDGSIPFIKQIPNFSVSIGLLKNNQPFVGVVNRVGVDELYWAQLGQGAFLNGQPIKVSNSDSLNKCVAGMEFNYNHRVEEFTKLFAPLVDLVRYPFFLGGTAVGMSLVALGNFDFYIHTAKIWDFAGGAMIVLEAGGKITTPQGDKIDWTKEDISLLASNNLIHEQVLGEINQ